MGYPRQRHTPEEWRTYLLHVECVRRNPRYRDGYKEWEKWQEQEDDFTSEWYKVLAASQWELLRTGPLPHPDHRPSLKAIKQAKPPHNVWLPGDERVDPAASKALDMAGVSPPAEHALPDSIKAGLLFLTLFPEQSPEKYTRTVVNIRRGKRSLMQSFEQFLDHALVAREEAGLSQQRPRRRIRLEECLDYLEVFDLKQSGKTHAKIGERMWPNSRGDVEKKSRTYYEKAKALIDSPPLMKRKP